MSEFQFNETGLSARRSIFDGTSAFGDAPSVDPVEAFERWMRNRKDPRGNRKFTDAKIRKRIEAFRGCRKIFRDAKICDVPLELVDDPGVLQQFESTFLSCPEYRRQPEKFRNRLKAAFHVYVAYRNVTKEQVASEERLLPLNGAMGDDVSSATKQSFVETPCDPVRGCVIKSKSNDERAEKARSREEFARVETSDSDEGLSVADDWIQCDFKNYDLFNETYPYECLIAGRSFHAENWGALLKIIVESELKHKKLELESLCRESLTGGTPPFFRLSKPAGTSRRFKRLNNSLYWIDVNFSAPDMVRVIVRFCQRCGYDDSQIKITGRKKYSNTFYGSTMDTVDATNGEETSLPLEGGARERTIVDEKKIIRCNFVNYDKFARTVPINCRIRGEEVRAKNWRYFLFKIVENEIKRGSPSLAPYYKKSLLSSRIDRPFFLSEPIDGQDCFQLSNKSWINVNHNIPHLVKTVVAFCRHCGNCKKDEIEIYGVLKDISHSYKKRDKPKDRINQPTLFEIGLSELELDPYRKTLEMHFSDGYRMNSSIERKKFRRFYEEVNGIQPETDDNALDNKIHLCGLEYKDCIYPIKTILNDPLKKKLLSYIEDCFSKGERILYFESIYQYFEEDFYDTNVCDSDFLGVYIKYIAGNIYNVSKSFLTIKDDNTPLLVENELKDCLICNGNPMKVTDICKKLRNIPPKKIERVLTHNGEFIRDSKGVYFHVNSFDLSKDDLQVIIGIIRDEINEHGYVSGKELFEITKNSFSDIYEKNKCYSRFGFRDSLKYLISDAFSFNGDIISDKDDNFSVEDLFEQFVSENKNFIIDELRSFADNREIAINLEPVYRHSARISYEQFVADESVSFQVEKTDDFLDRFFRGNFVSLKEIEERSDWRVFPKASHTWNSFLLEYYLGFKSVRYRLAHCRYNLESVAGAMVKRNSGLYVNFVDLIAEILAESDVNLTAKESLIYLSDKGYIARRSYKQIEEALIKARTIRNRKEG